MTTVAVRGDSPAALALNETDLVERSAAVVQASGYRCLPLSQPIGPWSIAAVCGQGFLLVSVVRDAWPSTLGALWGHPAGFPVNTRRVIHKWAEGPLPEAMPLG